MEDFGGEEKAFVVDEVNAVIKECIESTIQNAPYHHNKVGQWNSNIVEQCLKKLTGLNKPFKYISTCTIMQKNGAGLHVASSCFWDNASDGTATYKYDSKTMYIIVCFCMYPSQQLKRSTNLFKERLVKGLATPKEVEDLFKSLTKNYTHRSAKAVRNFPYYDLKHPFIMACKTGNETEIEKLLNDPTIDPTAFQNAGVLLAAQEGNVRVLNLLLHDKRIGVSDHQNLLFRLACANGFLRPVHRLLQNDKVDPAACDNEGLRFSLTRHHMSVAEILARDSRVDPSTGNNMAIAYFCGFGRTSTVIELLKDPRVDPAANNNYALLHATRKSNVRVVEALLRDARVDASDAILLADVMKNKRLVEVFKRFKLQGPGFLPMEPLDRKKGKITHEAEWKQSHLNSHNAPSNDDIFEKKVIGSPKGKNQELIDAISKNDCQKAIMLLMDDDFDPSECENSAIRLASSRGHLEIVQLLLKNPKVDPSAVANEALQVSCFFGHTKVVRELLKDSRVDPSAGNNAALRYCAFHGEEEMLETLLTNPKVDPSDINNDAIISASSRRHFSIVLRLVKDSRVDPSAGNGIVIINVCRFGTLKYLNELLKDPRVDPTMENNRALVWAIRRGNIEMVKRLLQDSRVVPTHNVINVAFRLDREEILEILFQNPKTDPSFNGNSSIVFACEAGFLNLVKFLLADPRVDPTVWDNLPIRVAAISGHFDIVETLIKDERVDPFSQENIVRHIAILRSKQNILNLLDSHPKNSGSISKRTITFAKEFYAPAPFPTRDSKAFSFTPMPKLHDS